MTMSAVISPAPGPLAPTMSMTSKEWVIPPRPKPGRKPATDTPPTKRKAQNRAAQRAFRERRAARVGELEEQLDQQRSEQEQQETDYKEKIRDLELEVQSFRSRCVLLENMLERERKERLQAETQLETLRSQNESRPIFRTGSLPGPGAMQEPPAVTGQVRAHHQQSLPNPATARRNESNLLAPITNLAAAGAPNITMGTESPLTCGNCEPTGRCACVEEVLNAGCGNCGPDTTCQCLDEVSTALSHGHELKRAASPNDMFHGQKRSRVNQTKVDSSQDRLSNTGSVRIAQSIESPHYMSPDGHNEPPSLSTTFAKDDCGFCKDGTYCVCADTAMATTAITPVDTLPPISAQTRTPPPSETDVVSQPMIMEMTAEGAVKLPRRKRPTQRAEETSKGGGCGSGGPGTCAQCRADPKSGLFCRLMAANAGKSGTAGGCCGGKGAAGGCCKSKGSERDAASSIVAAPGAANTPADAGKITLPSLPSLGLSCAEAYQTLSSHRNFERAADDIGSWLPLLKATPRGGQSSRPVASGRMMPMEVEAASIMSVLKDFDVRFGREA